MSKIHHFQRYSSYENVVTNNTLQLISRLYGYSPFKTKLFLNDLLEEELEIGINIYQQVRGKQSVPDGFVSQQSFKILVEAKVTAGIDVPQLLRHAESFGNEESRILIALTISPLPKNDILEISTSIAKKAPGIIFKSITYEDICKSLNSLFKEHEQIIDIVNDYVDYCYESNLIPLEQYRLRIVPTGSSFDLNKKYSVYYHPTYRGYTNHAYLGFYKWKAVRSIMKIEGIYDVTYKDGSLNKVFIGGENSNKFDHQIIGIINETKKELGWDVAEEHRFFCSSKSADTEFQKETPGGIQGHRYVNLKDYKFDLTSIEEIANKLKEIKWQ